MAYLPRHTQQRKDGQSSLDPEVSEHEISVGDGVKDKQAWFRARKTGAESPSWLRRNKIKLGIGVFALAGILSMGRAHDLDTTVKTIEHDLPVAEVVFPVTEGAAWIGAGLMLASAGSRIGNPLTIKSRLKEIRSDLDDNHMYRVGWGLGAAGAVGTSLTISVGALAVLPPSTWPLAASLSAASLGFSTIPFRPARSPELQPDSEVN